MKFTFKDAAAKKRYDELAVQHGVQTLHDVLRIPESDFGETTLHTDSRNQHLEANSRDFRSGYTSGTSLPPEGDHVVNHDLATRVRIPGHGTRTLVRQVLALRKMGIPKIKLPIAMGGKEFAKMNGHYTWPRLGFNGKIPRWNRDEWPHKDAHSLMDDAEAAARWKTEGVPLHDMEFDVHPDSEHSRRLLSYMREKGIKI